MSQNSMHGKSLVRTGGNTLRRFAIVALYVILLNGPFWVLATHVFVKRATVSLDSLLGFLILQFSPVAGMVAIATSWALDLALNATFTYHFASPLAFLRSTAFAGAIDWWSFLQAQAPLSALPFVASALVMWRLRRMRVGAWPVLAAMALLMVVDTINGSSTFSHRDVRVVPANIGGSSIHGIARALLDDSNDSQLIAVPVGRGGQAEFERYLPAAGSAENSVIYLIVESFGVHRHPAVRDWLAGQLFPLRLSDRFTLRQDTVEAQGGTTNGELQRLCGLRGSYRHFNPGAGATCLPQLFATAGWSTAGLHGFSETMFERSRWWPMLGLQHVKFSEQLAESKPRRCGAAFRGICDADLIATAFSAAESPKTFVYALTLNTHLPLAPIDIPPELEKACIEARTGADVRSLLAHLGVALRAIAIELDSRSVRPFVMVVGDHPPPFTESQSREQFLKDQVPLLALWPKPLVSSPALHARSP